LLKTVALIGGKEKTMNVELRQLSYFLKVYHEKNITKAAQKLHLSQQALSHSIKRLEDEWGHALFVRRPGGLEPTDFAEYMMPYVEKTLQEIRSTQRAAEMYSRTRVKVSVAIASNLIGNPDMGLITKLMEWGQKRNVELEWTESDCDSSIEQVLLGSADCALVYSGAVPQKLLSRKIPCGNCCIVMSSKNPMAQKEELYLADLQGQTFIYCKTIKWTELNIIKELKRRNVPVSVITPIHQASAMWEMIAGDKGITTNYARFAENGRNGLAVKPIADYQGAAEITFVWSKNTQGSYRHEQIEEIADVIARYFENRI